jgi:hypothetical protein
MGGDCQTVLETDSSSLAVKRVSLQFIIGHKLQDYIKDEE